MQPGQSIELSFIIISTVKLIINHFKNKIKSHFNTTNPIILTKSFSVYYINISKSSKHLFALYYQQTIKHTCQMLLLKKNVLPFRIKMPFYLQFDRLTPAIRLV